MKRTFFTFLLLFPSLFTVALARDNSRYVNLFMGTAGDHGQVSPAAQLPFGLASVCPDSKVPSHVGYDFDVPEISGISVTRVIGWVVSSTVCNAGAYKLYFCLHTNVPFDVESMDALTAQLRFPDGTRAVEVRIGLSSISEMSAMAELEAIAEHTFDQHRADAAAAWASVLDKVDVEGSTPEQRTLFYTSMYRVFLSPFNATYGGKYIGTDTVLREAPNWTFYSGWSIWATLQEPVPTVRTEHSQLTLLDAWEKGIRGFDLEAAFPGMEAEAKAGRSKGSVNGLTRNSPDQKMETIYDLWAMGQIARIIGKGLASIRYLAESEMLFRKTWKKEFMTITPDFSRMRLNGLYQGTRWQYRWAVPVYSDKLIDWVGEEQLADELSEFFSQHLFNQGNEPDIQTPFMFNLFGRPAATDSPATTSS